jgi:hypothetical protein
MRDEGAGGVLIPLLKKDEKWIHEESKKRMKNGVD